jgi:hypothetical protein
MPADWDAFKLEFDVPAELTVDAAGEPIDEATAFLLALDRSNPRYGSSLLFEYDLRHFYPHLLVPERSIVPITGKANAWTPEDETPPEPGEPCPKCGRSAGPGGSLCCPKCQHSGHERKLSEQRFLAGTPPAEAPENRWDYVPRRPKATASPVETRPRTPSRRERRAKQFGRAPETAPANEER